MIMLAERPPDGKYGMGPHYPSIHVVLRLIARW